MKEITLQVPNNKYKFFMELMKSLGFVKVAKADEGDSKEEIEANLRQGFREMKQIEEGKLKVTPAKDFLDEL